MTVFNVYLSIDSLERMPFLLPPLPPGSKSFVGFWKRKRNPPPVAPFPHHLSAEDPEFEGVEGQL